MSSLNRCKWASGDDLLREYHDHEWGVPCHDDRLLFEFLILEGMQAGLSWLTILRKRENFRIAFDSFDFPVVARYGPGKMQQLLGDSGIIRNRSKLEAAVTNARIVESLCREWGSFDAYIWHFTDGKTVYNEYKRDSDVPVSDDTAAFMSRDMKGRGLRFVGPIICYSFMQAIGMVNDHVRDCFRWGELSPK